MARIYTTKSRARRNRARAGDVTYKDYVSDFDKTILRRKAYAKRIEDAGLKLPATLRISIERPRKDFYGKRTEKKAWMEYLEAHLPELADRAKEREWYNGGRLSDEWRNGGGLSDGE
ncbi:hypothetical protein G7Y79_00031g066410 [Physcia stellaris]|nr:hypothetical protein G7Y79_00031g066410 [Physcia stellaris]